MTEKISKTSPPSAANKNKNYWQVHVRHKAGQMDGLGRDRLNSIRQIGLTHIEGVRSSRLYFFQGRLCEADATKLARELLTDPVVEEYTVSEGLTERDETVVAIEIHALPGVMDPVAMSTLDVSRRLLADNGGRVVLVDEVQTSRRYEIIGAKTADELQHIAGEVLANDCIETWYITGLGRDDKFPIEFPTPPNRPFELRHVSIRELGDDELKKLSRQGHLFLSLAEMQTIRDYYKELGRDPTDLELETLAQTWSEHCVHKTLKSAIEYKGEDFGRAGKIEIRFDNLLVDTIVKVTRTLDRDWCLSVFEDNAGVIAFDDEYGIAFKAETHNHPSAIEPYGGAATGIGGCIRDIMGCGLGAKPIASTDVFCLAPPDFDQKRLPAGVLHPRRILKGVVGGVRDYGNRMGIPTVNGAIYFDERYLANPLVFCGCIGLIPRDKIFKKTYPGDFIVVAGGRTGRDGIHGATFSSAELTDTHADEFSHAVQIGHAVEEKKVLDAMLLARDHESGCLYTAVTDCGAGGLSSAVGEMGEKLGATVDLEKVPLKYSGLRYDEIWISEAQERMVFSVSPKRLDALLEIFVNEEVEATVIGVFTDDRILHVRYDGTTVAKLDMGFLHDGLPKQTLVARWDGPKTSNTASAKASKDAKIGKPPDEVKPLAQRLLDELQDLNVASKEWVIRQYDHEVQGRSVIKPLVGPGAGPSDAAVLRPRYDSDRAVAIGCGLCPQRGDVDPYWMAVAAVDEALRNIICVGANPNQTAILDNFCWPKVDHEHSLGALVRTCRGAHDAALAYGLPFISGKDSLNNEFSMSAEEAKRTGLPQSIAIPYTLLITSLGIVDHVNQCVTLDLKKPDQVLVLASAPVDRVGLKDAMVMHNKVSELIRSGKVSAAHDVSDGGLITSVAEMCIAAKLGAELNVKHDTLGCDPFEDLCTSYILEMSEADAKASGLVKIGRVIAKPILSIISDEGASEVTIDELAAAWRRPLAQGGG